MANPLGAPSSDEEVHSNDEIFREIEDYEMEAEREEHVLAGDSPYMCLHRTSSGRMERVRLGTLGLQSVEPRPQMPTRDVSARTRYQVYLTRSWASFLVSLGWGTQLLGLPKIRDCTSHLVAI